MRLLINLVLCLIAAAVIASGTAAALIVTKELARGLAPAQQRAKAPSVGPRVQVWLDRKAEEQAYAEKGKAAALAEKERKEKAALAEKERAEALRAGPATFGDRCEGKRAQRRGAPSHRTA
jgi:hypothetical protein